MGACQTGFVIIAVFIVLALGKWAFDHWYAKKVTGAANLSSSDGIRLAPALICFIILTLWIWEHFSFWQRNVIRVAEWFSGEISESMLTVQVIPMLSKLGLSQLEIIGLWWNIYGAIFICLVLGAATALWVFIKTLSSPNKSFRNLFLLSAVFVVSAAIEIQHLFRPLVGLSFGRFLDFMLIPSTVLAGLLLYRLCMRFSGKMFRLTQVGIILLLAILASNSILAVYGSPRLYSPNGQVTHAELQGWHWLISKKDAETQVLSPSGERFSDMFFGREESNRQGRIWREGYPDHFGYHEFHSLSESVTEDCYMLLSEWNRHLYVDGAWSRIGRFNQEDFYKLELDHSVNRIYSTGEMQVFWVE